MTIENSIISPTDANNKLVTMDFIIDYTSYKIAV